MLLIQGLPDTFDKFKICADRCGLYTPPDGGRPILVTARSEPLASALASVLGLLCAFGDGPPEALPPSVEGRTKRSASRSARSADSVLVQRDEPSNTPARRSGAEL